MRRSRGPRAHLTCRIAPVAVGVGAVTGDVGFYSPSQTLEVAGGSDGRGGAATLSRACPIESDMQGAKRNPGDTRVIAVASTTAMLQDVGRKEGGPTSGRMSQQQDIAQGPSSRAER